MSVGFETSWRAFNAFDAFRRSGVTRTNPVFRSLALAAIIPLVLFGAAAAFLEAESQRSLARADVGATLDRVAQQVTVALQKELEVATALASLPSLDAPDLDRFYRSAQRIAPKRPLWETVSIANTRGEQIMNILRELGRPLGPVSDRDGFEQAIRTHQPVIGDLGSVGPVSGKRLVSITVPIIRDSDVANVLVVGLSPVEIERILLNAGAPKEWTGAIIDGKGQVITSERKRDGRAAAMLAASAQSSSGEYIRRTASGAEIETRYKRLAATRGWTVHFSIPSTKLNGPVSRSSLVLALSCCVCLLLAMSLAHSIARDLEQRRQEADRVSQLALAGVEDRAAVAVAAAELGVWRLDAAAGTLTGSARTRQCLFLPASPSSGDDGVWPAAAFTQAAHAQDRPRVEAALAAARDGVAFDVEFRVEDPAGGHRWLRASGRSMPGAARATAVQGVIADIHVLRTSQAERVQLLQRLAQAQENEQRRIARELHDQVGQSLTGLSLGLKRLETDVSDGPLRERVLWLESLTAEISRDIHRAAADLRPVALDDLGLVRALFALAAELTTRHHILFEVQAVGLDSGRLHPDVETAAYRIVQEAFTNVLKHSGATHASAILDRRADLLRIVIEDDGQGLAPGGGASSGDGFGLSNIRERLAALGGALRTECAHNEGFVLFIEFPLGADKAGA